MIEMHTSRTQRKSAAPMRDALPLALSIALLLALAGCFRPSAEMLEPTVNPNAEFAPNVSGQDSDSADSGDSDTTNGVLPPITLLAPETQAPASPLPTLDTANGADTALPTLDTGGIALTLVSPEPFASPTLLPTLAQAQNVEPTAGMQVITPGFGLPVTPDTPTPLPTRTPTISPEDRALTATADPDAFATQTASEEAEGGLSNDGCIYVIRAGDTLFNIAISYGTTVAALESANPGVQSAALQIGQQITLPACVSDIALTPTRPPAAAATEQPLPPGAQIYIVRPGDVLGAIASRFGVTVRAIVEANNLESPDRLSIGQRLIIPARGSGE